MVKKKHLPPSRIKYEQNNPNVSFRIEKNLFDKIYYYLDKEKITIQEFIESTLKKQIEKYEIAYNNGYKTGYEEGNKKGEDQGYNNGMNGCAIGVKCGRCSKLVYIKPNSKNHQMTINLVQGYISHDKCNPQAIYY
jgi:flagellar biosynthesis/type III secretory pathway protein FliH